ncbi:MAG: hypothetical protein JSV45_02380 [Chromatiales bacterium]|nr:MAG: hypothetical protein JSV45_02380 [Chromatiales bacterium]
MANSPTGARAPWLLVLAAAVGLSGCAASARSPDDTAAVALHALATSVDPGSPLAANAVVRQGPGGYQRTTVPPEFLVLMLGVPLLILLL